MFTVFKKALPYFFPPLFLVILVVYGFFSLEVDNQKSGFETDGNHQLKMITEELSNELREIGSDLKVLIGHSEIRKAIDTGLPIHIRTLAEEFLVFARARGLYEKIRLIDRSGMELISIQYRHGQGKIIAQEKLQNKKHRYYFSEVMALKENDVYISPFDLNLEQGEIERPLKPVIRFSIPVTNRHDRNAGILMLTFHDETLLHELEEYFRTQHEGFLFVNGNDFFFRNQPGENHWEPNYQESSEPLLQKVFPEIGERILKAASGQFYSKIGLVTFSTVNPYQEVLKGMHAAPTNDSIKKINRFSVSSAWKVISVVPIGIIKAASNRVLKKSLIIIIVISVILAVVTRLLAKSLISRKETMNTLRESEASLSEAQRIAHVGNWEWDLHSDLLNMSEEGRHIFQFEKETPLVHQDILNRIHPEDLFHVQTAVNRTLNKGGAPYNIEYRIILQDGKERFIHSIAECKFNDEGKAIWFGGTVTDITDRKMAEREIYFLAFYDPLTGLPNRSFFLRQVQEEILSGETDHKSGAVFLLDLDKFKEINDTLGHPAGDLLLKQVSLRIKGFIRPTDRLARIGGDEFAILLPFIKSDDALSMVQKMKVSLENEPYLLNGLQIAIEVSIGVVFFPEHGSDVDLLMQRADIAMYHAKRNQKQYMSYSPKIDTHSEQLLLMMGELRHAIDVSQLILHYQPKIDIKSGGLAGVEALIRWRHPKSGMVPPDKFVPLAEQTGLIGPLTRWVLREACLQYNSWRQEGHECRIAVNISVRNLQDRAFPKYVIGLLQENDIPPTGIEMEITETAIMKNLRRAQKVITKLKKIGICFSIDDFGTGYTSLISLTSLPVNTIKIDKSFIDKLLVEDDMKKIVSSIINLAHNLNFQVIAEGIEDKETFDQLAALNCDVAQGYYIGRPLSAEALGIWLKNKHD